MKLFNLSFFYLFVLVSIFTSCSEEIAQDQQVESQTELNSEKQYILLPSELLKQGDEAINDYISDLSEEDYIAHVNAYIITNYLEGLELNIQFTEYILNANFQNANFSDYLNEVQIAELDKSLVFKTIGSNSAELRGQCCRSVYVPKCFRTANPPGYFCCCEVLRTICYNCPGGPF